MTARDQLADLGAAIAAYLSAMQAAGECVTAAAPEVGKPYGRRIQKVHARLAFDPTRDSIRESIEVFQNELRDFAAAAARHGQQHTLEIRSSLAAVEEKVDHLEHRTLSFFSQISQVDTPRQNHELPRHLEAFNQEMKSSLKDLRTALRDAESSLTKSYLIDPLTGLMNRDEVTRRIEEMRANDDTHTLLLLEISIPSHGAVPEGILRQVAAKLAMQFRHQDILARWGEAEFLLVFRGTSDLAFERAQEALRWVCGPYPWVDGTTVDLSIAVRVEQPELLAV